MVLFLIYSKLIVNCDSAMDVGDVNETVDAEFLIFYVIAIAVLFVLQGIVQICQTNGKVYAGMVGQCHSNAGTDAQSDLVQGEVGAEGRVVPVAEYITATTLIAKSNIGKECPTQFAVNGHITAPKGFGIVEGVGIVRVAIGMYQSFVLVLGEERLLAV